MFTLQQQPNAVTCTQTCLAMALRVPVSGVIARFGDQGMSHQQFLAVLEACRFTYNQFMLGSLIVTGWYFLTVPSLNVRGGHHKILVHYDADLGCSGFTVLDPSTKETYQPDGSDLVSWSSPILFIPGGTLPQ